MRTIMTVYVSEPSVSNQKALPPLRDNQENAVVQVIDRIGDRPTLVVPTGSGKTRMGSWTAHKFREVFGAGMKEVSCP
jgi:superfamily II DNA or RNA helicase